MVDSSLLTNNLRKYVAIILIASCTVFFHPKIEKQFAVVGEG